MLHTSEISNKTTEQYPLHLENKRHQELLQLRGGWISGMHSVEEYWRKMMKIVEMGSTNNYFERVVLQND